MISIFSQLSPAGYHIWLTFLIRPKVTSCWLSLSSAGSSWLIWEWLSLACPILVEPCLAEPSQAEPSHGNTNCNTCCNVVTAIDKTFYVLITFHQSDHHIISWDSMVFFEKQNK